MLTPAEVGRILRALKGIYWLIPCLQYGSGLRLLESVRLRNKDLDFEHRAIRARAERMTTAGVLVLCTHPRGCSNTCR